MGFSALKWDCFKDHSLLSLIGILLIAMELSLSSLYAKEYNIQVKSLPEDLQFMPCLSNGHVGFTVFGDSIYVNGVYNGEGGDSRRARLPNWLNLYAHVLMDDYGDPTLLANTDSDFALNLHKGYFEWKQTVNMRAVDPTMQTIILLQRVYAHRFFNRALIYELFVQQSNSTIESSPVIVLQQFAGAATSAFNVTPLLSRSPPFLLKAITKQVEHHRFQPNLTVLYVALSDEFPKDKLTSKNYYRFIVTADTNLSVAQKEYYDVVELSSENLLHLHALEWIHFWKKFSITLEGNLELVINAGIFYLANSLSSPHTNQPKAPYCGLSPTGLGKGHLNSDYQGHSFWDTEIWMLPIITHLNSNWSLELLQYRINRLEAAQYYAHVTGFKGARFPWESAFTGTEVTNDCCPEVATQEIHISADVAVALQQLYAIIYDDKWLCRNGWPMLQEIANFLVSRVNWSNNTRQYHLLDVMGPDEDHPNIDDNAYTNFMARRALLFASSTQRICRKQDYQFVASKWQEVGEKLYIGYDAHLDYHPQYRNYFLGTQIKQADAILLGYPGLMSMPISTHSNDLIYYENVTRASGPAMTWSMYAINFLDLGLRSKAGHYFTKGFKDYVHPKFKVWAETSPSQPDSAVNFLTGIGGFLQSLVNGYGGLRFQILNNLPTMIVRGSIPPPDTEAMTINGIQFIDSLFTLRLSSSLTELDSYLICTKLGQRALQVTIDHHAPTVLVENIPVHWRQTIKIQAVE